MITSINEFKKVMNENARFWEKQIKSFLNKFELNQLTQQDIDLISEEDWTDITSDFELSEAFIKHFQDKFDDLAWDNISGKQKLSENFILEFKDKLFMHYVLQYQTLTEDFIRKLIALNVDIDWDAISYNDKIILSEEFLDEFKDFIDFDLYEQRNEDYYENNPQY